MRTSDDECVAIGGTCCESVIPGWAYCPRHLQQPHIGAEYLCRFAVPEVARSLSAEDKARDAVVDATMAWWAVLSVQGAVALAHPTLVPEWRAACAALAKLKP